MSFPSGANVRRLLIGLAVTVGIGACDNSELEPLPFEVGIEASRSVTVPGDTVSFVVVAQAGRLFGVEMDFGDSTTDIFGTSGARTARVTFRHAYRLKGTYTVSATVTDATAGQKKATVEIRVN
jgi:hypothetical protein